MPAPKDAVAWMSDQRRVGFARRGERREGVSSEERRFEEGLVENG